MLPGSFVDAAKRAGDPGGRGYAARVFTRFRNSSAYL